MTNASPIVNEMVRAGAGAGKTRRLVQTVVDYCQRFRAEHGRFPRLVLTTFTRKSTQELRERLVDRACELQIAELMALFSSPTQIRITTIHGVLAGFLKEYGALAGLDPAFQVIDATTANRMTREILREILQSQDEELLDLFRFDELCAMLRELAPFLWSASPVTAVGLVDLQNARREAIAILNNEIRAACESVAEQTADPEWTAWASGVLRWIERDPETLSEVKPPRWISKKPAVSDDLRAVLDEIKKKVKDFLGKESFTLEAMPAQVRVHELFDDLATRFSARFQDRKLRSGVLEIADLEPLSERVIVDHPELARAFAQDWDFWLIDEYQDTSPAQVRLLTALIGEKPAFIVGDPQQSIYSFRGARSEVFEVKWQQEVERGSATDVLMDNYRTQAPLMHFINDLLSGAKGRFAPMSPKKSISPEAFPPASLYPCDDAEGAEPCWPGAVTTHLRRLVEAGASLGQVVILGRERKHLEEVASVLRRWGWPCHVHAAGGYGDRREIADLVALVRLMIHAEDNRNLIALLRSPWFRVEDESIKAAIHAMDTGAFWDRLIASSDLHEHPSLRILIRMRTDARAIGVSAALVRCLDESGWLDDALRFDPTGRMESNVWKFLAQLRQFERSGQTNFLGFLETQGTRAHVEESDDTQDAVSSVEPNRIQLMTVHGAKGLEFDHVLSIHIDREPRGGSNRRKIWVDEQGQRYTIPAAVDEDESRSFPVTGLLLSREEQRRQRAEEERVFYVAATRARKTWALFWDDSRMGKGATAFLQGWDLTAGTHIDPLYTYHVDRGPFAPTAFDGGRAADADVVRPWTPSGAIPEGRRRKSVSQILEEQAEPAAVAGTGSGTGKEWATIQAAAKGIEFHRLMESIKYAPASARDGWTGSMRQAVDWCLQLQDPPLARIIEAGEVEWGFQYLQEDLIVEGQIDLWGVVDGVTYVVDYKTGSPDLNKAFRQLHLYAEALVRLDRSRKIRLVVLQPFRQKVNCVWPSELVSVNFALRSAADDGTGKLTR